MVADIREVHHGIEGGIHAPGQDLGTARDHLLDAEAVALPEEITETEAAAGAQGEGAGAPGGIETGAGVRGVTGAGALDATEAAVLGNPVLLPQQQPHQPGLHSMFSFIRCSLN